MMGARKQLAAGHSAALNARAGIDPRLWLSWAVVQDVAYDKAHNNVFADVTLMPDGIQETCLVGTHSPEEWVTLAKGDLVLVAIPSGTSNLGPVIMTRVYTSTRPPPSWTGAETTMDVSKNRVIQLRDGESLHIQTTNGTIGISSDNGLVGISAKDVLLEAETTTIKGGQINLDIASAAVARVGDSVTVPALMVTLPATPTFVPGSPALPLPVTLATPAALATPTTGTIATGNAKVKA